MYKNKLQNLKTELLDLVSGIKKYSSTSIPKHQYNGAKLFSIGSTDVYSYASEGVPVLIIPSLINKASILDLSKDMSLVLRLKSLGLRPILIAWNDPNENELNFGLKDYNNRLKEIIEKINEPMALLGYCMGGFMALMTYPEVVKYVSHIITIATPWDFNSKNFQGMKNIHISFFDLLGFVPKEIIRDMFAIQHISSGNKYIELSRGGLNIKDFAIIENWVNDGMNMTLNLFKDLKELISQNYLMTLDLSKFDTQTLNIIAKRDSVCPINTTLPLSMALPNSTTKFYDAGHVGMIIKDKFNLALDISEFLMS